MEIKVFELDAREIINRSLSKSLINKDITREEFEVVMDYLYNLDAMIYKCHEKIKKIRTWNHWIIINYIEKELKRFVEEDLSNRKIDLARCNMSVDIENWFEKRLGNV